MNVTKVWDDCNDQDGVRPESVTVELFNGTGKVDEFVLDASNGWKHTFTDLPMYSAGSLINYTIGEVDVGVDGYESDVSNNTAYNWTVTNSYVPLVTDLNVTKVWNDSNDQNGLRPVNVTIVLVADGVVINSTVLNSSNDWKFTFIDLPVYNNGILIGYNISEVKVDNYNTVISNNTKYNWTVTNSIIPVIIPNMTVEKITVNKTVLIGEKVIFTINVTNSGDSELTNVNVVENVPKGLKYNGEFTGENWKDNSDNTFTFEGTLKPGESASFNIVFVADGNASGDIENTVVVSSDKVSNVSAKNNTTVLKPEMSIEIEHDKEIAEVNDTIKYIIVITNDGNVELPGVFVEDMNTDDLIFHHFDDPENWDYNNGTWTYNKPLGVNETVSLNVYYTVVTSGVKDKTFVIGNNATFDVINGTKETVVNTTTEDIPSNDTNNTEVDIPPVDKPINDSPSNETNTTSELPPVEKRSTSKVIADKNATGNPLVLILLALFVLGFVPKRKN